LIFIENIVDLKFYILGNTEDKEMIFKQMKNSERKHNGPCPKAPDSGSCFLLMSRICQIPVPVNTIQNTVPESQACHMPGFKHLR